MEFHTNKNTSITSYNISAPSDMEYLRNASNDTKRIKRVENRSLETLNSGEILDIEYINISNHYFAKTVTILVGYRFCECVSPGGHHSLVFDPKNPKTS